MECRRNRETTKAARDLIAHTEDLRKAYMMGEGNFVEALRGVTLEIPRGAFYALMGPSGSGKSTLLNLLGSLDQPTSGIVCLEGREIGKYPKSRLPELRRRLIGFIFQGFNLIPSLNALENVMLPLRYEGTRGRAAREHASSLLEQMGLGGRLTHRPSELSGGEQQRVAIARALVMDPPLILADEPTGEVDTTTGAAIMQTLGQLNERGQTIVMVTHDPQTASYAEKVVQMQDGLLI